MNRTTRREFLRAAGLGASRRSRLPVLRRPSATEPKGKRPQVGGTRVMIRPGEAFVLLNAA